MVGHVDPQRSLYTCDNQYLKFVGEDTFYGFLARPGSELFRDDDFVSLYTQNNGRMSVPPSILAKALLLQSHDRVSDEEAADRARFDIRWKVALGIGVDDAPFVKSTLQAFHGRLVLHQAEQAIFQRSIDAAKGSGLLKSRKLKVALDTTPIFGRGAVKDTYNLLADGIRQLVRALALLSGQAPEAWAREHDLSRYYGTSIKGEAEIDWDNAAARQVFLDGIVVDAERLLKEAERVRAGYPADSAESVRIDDAASLLKQLLVQDVERTTEGRAVLKDGVAPDRIPSVTDPQMRHGRKSASRKFTGHKGAIAVDAESGVITAADVLPGNVPDNTDALALVEETKRNTGCEVAKVIGDCAYGDGATRRAFKEQGCELVVKVPRGGKPGYYAKGDFKIDLEHGTVTCPAGQVTSKWKRVQTEVRGERVAVKRFEFGAERCRACPHYRQCVSGKRGQGRSITLHPEEELMQQARAYQETAAFREDTKLRQAAEHRLARLVQLGIRQARYFGRAKTKWQLLLAAAVANLVLVAAWELATGTLPDLGAFSFGLLLQLTFFLLFVPSFIGETKQRQHLVFPASTRVRTSQNPGFRPDS
ncbi:MAG: IS1182 family transposase [candidate division WOR-3 bacterium]|nr:IS1182 family transposase [candidate division WOR-3 bacterium]